MKSLIDSVSLDYNRILTSSNSLFLDRSPNTDNISIVEYPSGAEVYTTKDFLHHGYLRDGLIHINPFGAIIVPGSDSTYVKSDSNTQNIPLKALSDYVVYILF